MAKIDERRVAEFYFCEKFYTQKEAARKAGVSEKTVGVWVKRFGWKKKQETYFNKTKSRTERVKELISKLTERNLEIFSEIKEAEKENNNDKIVELRKESNKLSQEVAMQSKLLQQIDKESRITLGVYMEVMESIFRHMQVLDAVLHKKTLDFQEQHLNEMAIKLG